MAETDLHRRLASALHGYMRRAGVTVTHSVATLSLPDPVRIVRHEPDVLGYGADCVCIGEAKRGPELFDRHTQEQLYDFSRRHVTGWGRSTLFLYVPRAYRERARAAVIAAGGDISNTRIIVPPAVRVRPKRAPQVKLKQRGRVQPVATSPLQRGREQPVPRGTLAALLRSQRPR
jgi:hypothetical protein